MSPNETYLDRFIDGYTECALWVSTDETTEDGGEPLDSGEFSLAPETISAMVTDCTVFVTANLLTLARSGQEPEQAGHDFWLSRNGHGSGYFDADEIADPAIREELQGAARNMGERTLYVGDDGLIYML